MFSSLYLGCGQEHLGNLRFSVIMSRTDKCIDRYIDRCDHLFFLFLYLPSLIPFHIPSLSLSIPPSSPFPLLPSPHSGFCVILRASGEGEGGGAAYV